MIYYKHGNIGYSDYHYNERVKSVKLALIYPEVYDIARHGNKRKEFPPFGVMYLATILNRMPGYEVKIFNVSSPQTQLDLRAFDVVAFSIPSSVTYSIMRGVRANSYYAHNALLIAGGVHATLFPEQTLREMQVHAVGIGHGEETILELVAEAERRQFSGIKGICFMSGNECIFTPLRPLKEGLDHLPAILDRELLPDPDFILSNRLARTNLRMTHVMMSMGCPFSCNFCASQQRKMQYRSGQHIRQELEDLISRYGIEGFAAVEDNFLINKRRVREVCASIADLGLRWSTLSRVDGVDEPTLIALKQAGCIEIKFGIESGSARILEAMNKRITLKQIEHAIRMVHGTGIMVKAFIIHGYPGEDAQSTAETIQLLKRHSGAIAGVSLFRFVPLPGSRVYADAAANRLHLRGGAWEDCHIHHNPFHWWGTDEEFAVVEESYHQLLDFVTETWG